MKNNGKLSLYIGAATLLFSFSLIALSQCQTMLNNPKPVRENHRTPAEFEPDPKPVVVAVIDTGFDFKSDWTAILRGYPKLRKPRMCKYGHKTFVGTDLADNHGHGTHITGIIAQNAGDANYCIVAIKYFDPKAIGSNLDNTRQAFQYAMDIKVDVINYSGGGEEYSKEECDLVKRALDSGIIIVAAAGNEKSNVNEIPYYPAMCDPRIRMVSNVYDNGNYVQSSNYTDDGPKSRFLHKEIGYNLINLAPNNQLAVMTGTSQATAVQTGKLIKDWNKH